jgi:single-strand selective monofunctional uracil DNA glycosylase
MPSISHALLAAGRELADRVDHLKFRPPVAYVYNTLDYAWPGYEKYVRWYARGRKRVVFTGMNPGPFGMVQTGVPFGEITAVRDWLGIRAKIGRPARLHPKRPVLGFDCPHSEVSGRRLWGLFARRYGTAEKFFGEHFVANYCPLAFCEDSGRNRTPPNLPVSEREALFAACDAHLRRVLEILQPEWLIGIGGFAFGRAEVAVASTGIRVGQILHPSPASPAANRGDWGTSATKQLVKLGVWTGKNRKGKSEKRKQIRASLPRLLL